MSNAHAEAVRETQITHRSILQHTLVNAARAAYHVSWDGLRPREFVGLLKDVINMQRLVLGQPVTIEDVRAREMSKAKTEASQQIATEVDVARFEASPEMLAAAMLVLEQCETHPEAAAAREPEVRVDVRSLPSCQSDSPPPHASTSVSLPCIQSHAHEVPSN